MNETLLWVGIVAGAVLFFGVVGALQARLKRRGALRNLWVANKRWVMSLVIGVIAMGLLSGAAYLSSLVMGQEWMLRLVERAVDGMRTETALWIMGISAVALVLWIIGVLQDRGELRYREKELLSLYPSGVMGEGERAWTVELEMRLEQVRQQRERRKAFVRFASMLVPLLIIAGALAQERAVEYVITFWQPILLFAVGTYGFVRARQLVVRYNTWDAPYTFSIVSGFGGFILGVIKLVQVL